MEAADTQAVAWQVIGEALASARHTAGLSQQYLAERLEVRGQTISDWERAVQRPSLETLAALEQALCLPRGHFLRVGGFVAECEALEDRIRAEPRLRPEHRQLLLAALESFVRPD